MINFILFGIDYISQTLQEAFCKQMYHCEERFLFYEYNELEDLENHIAQAQGVPCVVFYDQNFFEQMLNLRMQARAQMVQMKIVMVCENPDQGLMCVNEGVDYALQLPLRTNKISQCFDKITTTFQKEEQYDTRVVSRFDSVEFFESVGKKSLMHINKKVYLINFDLKDLESQLSRFGFIRTHPQYLVNAFYIDEIINSAIFTKSGYAVLICQRRYKSVRSQYDKLLQHIGC